MDIVHHDRSKSSLFLDHCEIYSHLYGSDSNSYLDRCCRQSFLIAVPPLTLLSEDFKIDAFTEGT